MQPITQADLEDLISTKIWFQRCTAICFAGMGVALGMLVLALASTWLPVDVATLELSIHALEAFGLFLIAAAAMAWSLYRQKLDFLLRSNEYATLMRRISRGATDSNEEPPVPPT